VFVRVSLKETGDMKKFILILILLCFPVGALGSDLNNVKDAIKNFISNMPAHPLNKSDEKLTEIAQYFLDAESETGLDWELLVVIGYRESSFKRKVKGQRGERGVMQINKDARVFCKKKLGRKIDVYNYQDNISCGAMWFKEGMKECNNTIKQGLAKYSSQHTCNPKKGTDRLKYAVRSRMRQYRKLLKKYDSKE